MRPSLSLDHPLYAYGGMRAARFEPVCAVPRENHRDLIGDGFQRERSVGRLNTHVAKASNKRTHMRADGLSEEEQ